MRNYNPATYPGATDVKACALGKWPKLSNAWKTQASSLLKTSAADCAMQCSAVHRSRHALSAIVGSMLCSAQQPALSGCDQPLSYVSSFRRETRCSLIGSFAFRVCEHAMAVCAEKAPCFIGPYVLRVRSPHLVALQLMIINSACHSFREKR